ncbi:MAG TPA: IS630 family transposase [Bryobacteraceae bacterium]|nr:IS630 family transposase [Bryobacteraceae bacterium]
MSAAERHRPAVEQARGQFRARLAQWSRDDLVFVDESGVRTNMTGLYGRAPKGIRVPEAVPHGHWKVLTILGAVTSQGVQASVTIDAATDSDIFLAFLRHALAPTLRPGPVIVMDNLPAHKHQQVRTHLRRHGCRLLYLPPYSPDLNPIEPAWSK